MNKFPVLVLGETDGLYLLGEGLFEPGVPALGNPVRDANGSWAPAALNRLTLLLSPGLCRGVPAGSGTRRGAVSSAASHRRLVRSCACVYCTQLGSSRVLRLPVP